jgi:uncharacterized cupin superfamily protein
MNRWTDLPGQPNRLTGQHDGPYAEPVLGEQAGPAQFGVRMERVPPGSRTSEATVSTAGTSARGSG